jgi:hypothetical protein
MSLAPCRALTFLPNILLGCLPSSTEHCKKKRRLIGQSKKQKNTCDALFAHYAIPPSDSRPSYTRLHMITPAQYTARRSSGDGDASEAPAVLCIPTSPSPSSSASVSGREWSSYPPPRLLRKLLIGIWSHEHGGHRDLIQGRQWCLYMCWIEWEWRRRCVCGHVGIGGIVVEYGS